MSVRANAGRGRLAARCRLRRRRLPIASLRLPAKLPRARRGGVLMAQDRVVSEVVGVVSAVHGNGFRLRDRDGFLNISRFCDPVPAMPAVGEAVAVGVDAKGYVRTIASVAVAGELDALDDRPVPAPAGPPNKDTQ